MIDSIPLPPLELAAVVVATVAAILYGRAKRPENRLLGPENDFWEILRAILLPVLHRLAKRRGYGYAAGKLPREQKVGVLDLPPEEAENLLYSVGFLRNPLAAYKYTEDGRGEVGSWVRRDSLLARRQLHVTLFPESEGDGTVVYAHEEHNAMNPLTAYQHYRGRDINVRLARDRVRSLVPFIYWRAGETPGSADEFRDRATEEEEP